MLRNLNYTGRNKMDVEVKLKKSIVVLRAKDDTYLSSRTILATNDVNKDGRYEMQADESAVHERKLLASLGIAVSELKSGLTKFRMKDTLTDKKDSFTLIFEVSDRFRMEALKDLQRLTEEYLYRKIVSDWWQANYPEMANQYVSDASSAMEGVVRLLSISIPYDVVGGIKFKCFCQRNHRIVLLYKEELMNEIHTELLKLSKSRANEKGMPDFNLQTNELEDETLLTRYVNRHISRICSRVNAYLCEFSNTVDNDMMDRVPVYKFTLIFPKNWDGRLFEQLAEEMHSYIVNASITEWLKSYLPDMASIYGSQADVSYDNIKHVISVRKPHSIHKPLQPF